MTLLFTTATPDEVDAVLTLRMAVAHDLTRQFGHGHWSCVATEKSVLRDIKSSRVLLALDDRRPVGTVRLATNRPWAIDPHYFSICARALYLTDMAVAPDLQRLGIGRRCMEHARTVARAWPADAIRLDAYEGAVGAGPFYAKCGFHERGRITYRNTRLIYYEQLIHG